MSTPPTLRLAQRGRAFDLFPGPNDGELDEGPVLLTLTAETCPTVALDDILLPIEWRKSGSFGACTFDLTNQVGYHRIHVRSGAHSFAFDFRTRTAKAAWDEVHTMAKVCGRYYLNYRRKFTYLDKSGARRKVLLPEIHFAWLRDRVPEISALAKAINERPALTSFPRMRTAAQVKGMNLPATIKFLREKPYLLEKKEGGPIAVGNSCYWPSLVKVKMTEKEPALREHAEIANFMLQIVQGCRDLVDQVDASLRSEIWLRMSEIQSVLDLPVFAAARRRLKSLFASAIPTQIQRLDSRYGRLRTLRAEYFADIAPAEGYRESIRANIKDISEIYQTFVAHVIGNALGLEYCSENYDLRDRATDGASMRSGRWALGFDSIPPGNILSSWRSCTNRPASERPDISLVGNTLDESIVLDAKFKQDKNSLRATQVDLFEMQGYLNSFGMARGGIIFPGAKPIANLLEGRSNLLLELPIRAKFFEELGGAPEVHAYIGAALHSAMGPIRS